MTTPPDAIHPTQRAVVHVVDDDPSIRAALADLLDSVGLSAILYANAADALNALRCENALDTGPRCVVLDVRMPGQSGLELQAELQALGCQIPVIFITAHGDIPMSVRALKAGAVDFLPKPFSDQALLDAIHHALAQDQAAREQRIVHDATVQRYAQLSPGEQDVLRLVTRGMMNKQIASVLDVSEITVKVRRGRVMRKMEARSLAELVQMSRNLPFHDDD